MPSRTLSDLLVSKLGVALTCTSCNHTKTMDVLAMSLKYGEDATLDQIEPRMAGCSKCGGKGAFEVWSRLPPEMGMKE